MLQNANLLYIGISLLLWYITPYKHKESTTSKIMRKYGHKKERVFCYSLCAE